MKKLTYSLIVVSIFLVLLPDALVFAQKKPPQVPVTYAGDTDQIIARRAQWIENAKKEGQLTWWGIFTPTDAKKIISEFNKIYPFIKVNYWRGTNIIPGIKQRDKRIYGKDGDWAQAGNNANTPHFNTEKIKAADAPKSWDDLLNPRWKGKIGFNSGSVREWTALALAEGGWGLNKTIDFLSTQEKMVYLI